jgi:hypothetical protein
MDEGSAPLAPDEDDPVNMEAIAPTDGDGDGTYKTPVR